MKHPAFTDLTLQWHRMCQGQESPASVAGSLDAWRRQCPVLAAVKSLEDVLLVISGTSDAAELALRYLVGQAQTGDKIAHFTAMYRFLPLFVRNQARLGFDESCEQISRAWELIAAFPLERPNLVGVGLSMRITHPSAAHFRREVKVDPAELNRRTDACEIESLVEFESLLADLTTVDQQLLRHLFVDDMDCIAAGAAIGLSPSAARKRKERALAKLRHALVSAAA